VYYSSCDPSGNVYPVTAQWTTGAPVVSGLSSPAGIDFDKDGNLYVACNGSNVIKRFEAGTWVGTTIAGQQGISGYLNGTGIEAKFSNPWGLAVDAAGNIYVAGNGTWDGGTYNADQSIRYIEANTWNVSTFAGSGTAGFANAIGEAAAFSAPTGVAVDKNGTVYVLDKNNNCIRKIISE
jgi:sugar lactone lactonase YvrE